MYFHQNFKLFVLDDTQMQDLMNQYVSDKVNCRCSALERLSHFCLGMSQLVCFYYILTTFTTVGYGENILYVHEESGEVNRSEIPTIVKRCVVQAIFTPLLKENG
jgi:hypothetical protein